MHGVSCVSLREKAGWPAEGWESDLEVWRFEAESF